MGRGRHDESADDTRGKLLALLCSGDLTSRELANELGITPNGVRGHLHILRRAGLVEHRVVRRGVGKPAHEYLLTPEGSARLSRVYLPLLSGLVSAARQHGGAREEETLLRTAGRSLAQGLSSPDGELRARAQAAVELISELGGISSMREDEGGLMIHGTCCLVRALVPEHPLACKAVESMVEEFIGAPVREDCNRTTPPVCRLLIGQGDSTVVRRRK